MRLSRIVFWSVEVDIVVKLLDTCIPYFASLIKRWLVWICKNHIYNLTCGLQIRIVNCCCVLGLSEYCQAVK